MAEQKPTLPHDLTLTERKHLTLTGVTEVMRFDEEDITMRTTLGLLAVHGNDLKLKTLSLDGGHVVVDGDIQALIYQQDRPDRSGWRKLFQ